jgi:hypothetical protein
MRYVVRESVSLLQDDVGRPWLVRVVGGDREDGRYAGWLEFFGPDGEILRTEHETVQGNLDAVAYWASGLQAVYVEGALARARPVAVAPVAVDLPPDPEPEPPSVSEPDPGGRDEADPAAA